MSLIAVCVRHSRFASFAESRLRELVDRLSKTGQVNPHLYPVRFQYTAADMQVSNSTSSSLGPALTASDEASPDLQAAGASRVTHIRRGAEDQQQPPTPTDVCVVSDDAYYNQQAGFVAWVIGLDFTSVQRAQPQPAKHHVDFTDAWAAYAERLGMFADWNAGALIPGAMYCLTL